MRYVDPGSKRLRVVALVACALPALASGQESSAHEQEGGSTAVSLPPVIVTATRRSESLQKVPIAVSAFSGDKLEQDNRNTLASLSSVAPSVNFRIAPSNRGTSLFIRGVGTISPSPGVEPSVSTVIDGVVLARPGQSTLDLLDIDRVEVLRGSQGTLFGKNASAGVIHIVTRAPASVFDGYLDASHFGGGNESRLRAGISGPLAPGLGGSLTLLGGRWDGNVVNVFDGSRVNGYTKKGARAKLEWKASPSATLTLSGDVMNSHDDVPTGVVTRTQLTAYPSGAVSNFPAFAAALAPVVASDANTRINANLTTEVFDRNHGLSLAGEFKLGGHTLTAITAWRSWTNRQIQDGDRLAAPVRGLPESHDRGRLDFSQWSQELRVASPRGPLFDYVAGLYYLHTRDVENYRRDVLRVGASGALYADNGVADYGVNTDSASVFGEGRWHLSPSVHALLGLRLNSDKLDFFHARLSTTPDAQFAGAIPGVSPSVSLGSSTRHKGTSGRAGLQWDLSESSSSYFTYTRGYKGQAYNVIFNMVARDTLLLQPETSRTLEAGLKTELLDHALRLNAAIFDTRYRGFQTNFFDIVAGTVVNRLINAGDASSRGVEVEATWRATSALSLNASLTRNRARIDHFACPVGAAASCQVDGRPLPFAPDWKTALRASYRLTLAGGWRADLDSDYSWQSRTQYDISQFPDTLQPAYGIWNASVAFTQPEQGWRIALLARNLADRSYASQLAVGSSYVVRSVPRDDQRYFGINVRREF